MLIVLCCFVLSNCNNELTYNYLVLHLNKLEEAYSNCQIQDAPTCSEIKRAAHDMGEIAYEQSKDPELFGQRIMEQQWLLQKLSKKLNAEKSAQDSRQAVREKYDEQFQKLQMMYAVVASHGPK
jgi:hypothetical protein